MKKIYLPKRSKKHFIQHRYCRRIKQNLDDYTFWGIRLEVLFRGFSPSEMFQIESEIRDLIARTKSQALKTAQLREVVLEHLIIKPFKDEVI